MEMVRNAGLTDVRYIVARLGQKPLVYLVESSLSAFKRPSRVWETHFLGSHLSTRSGFQSKESQIELPFATAKHRAPNHSAFQQASSSLL